MKVKGTIVITDPCYLKSYYSSCLMRRNTIYGDWSCMVYKGTMEGNSLPAQWYDFYFKFFYEYNSEPIRSNQDAKKEKYEEFMAFKKKWLEDYCLGEFCADAGEVGVFEYDNLNDENKQWIKEHPWCAAVIEDFDGDVEFVVKDDSLHIIGTGNKPFFTVQSGL